jgi:hypothetical protein
MRKIPWMMALLVLMTAYAVSQDKPRAEILVLGTYHMGNPGRDVADLKADDVRSPQRQKELDELLSVLKRFQPTKIAVEDDVDSPRLKARYEEYLAGKQELRANEVDQIGFRLGRELGHKNVYGVDEEGDFPLQHVINFAAAKGRSKEIEAQIDSWKKQSKVEEDYLHSHNLLQMFLLLNSDESSARGVAGYYSMVPLGEPGDYAAPDLLAAWFQRNIRIFHNIRALVQSPQDRILVIYGAGHLGWLQQDVANDPTLRLRKLSEYVSKM